MCVHFQILKNSAWSPRKLSFLIWPILPDIPICSKQGALAFNALKRGLYVRLEQFEVCYPYLLLLGYLWMPHTTLKNEIGMHSDCLKILSQNEISSSLSFEVRRLVPTPPYAPQKSCFEHFKVVCPYLLLLGNPKMSQTTLRYTN